MGNKMTFSLGYKVNITFLPVEPGTFVMGDEEEFNEYGWAEKPKHEVTISNRFWLGEFPVTRIQWQYVMGYKTYEYTGGIDRPVENITWKEAQAFCKKLNERFGGQLPEGYEFFLPTEAQWEYACQTGLEAEYDLNEIAWFGECMKTRPVGLKKPNKWGLYDMLGNVWEWYYDWYNMFPDDLKRVNEHVHEWRDPVGVGTGHPAFESHVVRGGHYHSKAEKCNPFFRETPDNGEKNKYTGFRAAIRPKEWYFYWDEWDEIADRGYAVEEGECSEVSSKVGDCENNSMNFSVCGNFHDDAPSERYFKLYDDWTWWQATKVIRIKFTSPEYQLYENVDRKLDWILTEEEKVHLMELLKADDCSLWKDLIRAYNHEVFGEYTSEDGIPEDLPIPDYTRLPDKIERK